MFGLLSVGQRAAGGNAAYFLGELSGDGWWYYFPVMYLLKEPLPILLLLAIGLFYLISKVIGPILKRKRKLLDLIELNFAETSMLLFTAGYWLYSISTPLNIGVRHILPTIPFIYILATAGVKNFFTPKFEAYRSQAGQRIKAFISRIANISLKLAVLVALLIWFVAEIAFSYPFYLSYYNQFAGGTLNGYRYATDSNYDWGQDLGRLEEWVERNNVDKIAIDYFGGGNPKYYLGDKAEFWWSARGNPRQDGIEWLAVSINSLEGAFGKTTQNYERKMEDEYKWLGEIKPPSGGLGAIPTPDARVGTSIFLYKL